MSRLCLIAGVFLSGCSRAAEPELYPLRGVVMYRHEPIPEARLVFHPQFEGPGWMPVAISDVDGSFAVATRVAGDGALPGIYKVAITWRPGEDEDEDAPNVLPSRYADPATSGLEVEIGPASTVPAEFHLED